MKRGKRKNALANQLPGAFARGFVTTALVAGLQGRREAAFTAPPVRKILRYAVQGGTALAAGTLAADALQSRNISLAMIAVAAGAAGLIAAEYLLDEKENGLGQEE